MDGSESFLKHKVDTCQVLVKIYCVLSETTLVNVKLLFIHKHTYNIYIPNQDRYEPIITG